MFMLEGMIYPIGRYEGATGDGTHEVRRGGAAERLDATQFAAWGLAHGPIDPVLAAGMRWTRKELVHYAGLAGLADAAEIVTGLLARGLLADAPPAGTRAVAFARAHRAVPLALGLGNRPEAPTRFTIGFHDQPLIETDERRYEVWCWSTVYKTLWQVCEMRSQDGDPAEVLSHFLTGVHQLAAANALYLDVVA
jgi:hypothetical protein